MKLKVGILIIAVLAFSLHFFRTKQEDTSKPTQKEATLQLSQKKASHPPEKTPPKLSQKESAQPPAKEIPLPEKPKRVETETESSISDIILAKTVKMILRQVVNHVDIEAKRQYAIEKIKRKSDVKYLKEINKIFDDLEYYEHHRYFRTGT